MPVGVGGGSPQIAAHISGDGGVAARARPSDHGPGTRRRTRRMPRPGDGTETAVRIRQRRRQRGLLLRLHRRQRHRAILINVGDRDSHTDRIRQQRRISSSHRHRIRRNILIVQHRDSTQLPRGGINPEQPRTTAQRVGQIVTIGITSLNRRPHNRTSRKTLSHTTLPRLITRKSRRPVGHRCCDDGVGGDCAGGLG